MSRGYKLTGREKLLLWLLVIMLAAAGTVYFLIMPAAAAHRETAAELAAVREQYDGAVEASLTVQMLRAQTEAARARITELAGLYGPLVNAEDIEGEFTNFMLANGITPASVSVEVTELGDVGSGGGDASAGRAASGSAGGAVGYGNILPYKFTLNINGAGAFDDLLGLPDYVNGVYSYRLVGMGLSAGGGDYAYGMNGASGYADGLFGGAAALGADGSGGLSGFSGDDVYGADFTVEALLMAR